MLFYNNIRLIQKIKQILIQNNLSYYSNNVFIVFTETTQYIYSAVPDIPKSYTPSLMRRINTPIKDSVSEGVKEKKGTL